MAETQGEEPLKTAILLLENMDDLLISTCREAMTLSFRTGGPLKFNVPTSEADLRLLEAAREGYKNSNYAPQDMANYLAAFPDLKRYWQSLVRTVVIFQERPSRSQREWRVRAKQLQDAGDEAWRAAVPASGAIGSYSSAASLNALTAKFRLVDDILDPLYESIPEIGTRQSFGDEFNDTLYVFPT
jgi:hypothetical protein